MPVGQRIKQFYIEHLDPGIQYLTSPFNLSATMPKPVPTYAEEPDELPGPVPGIAGIPDAADAEMPLADDPLSDAEAAEIK